MDARPLRAAAGALLALLALPLAVAGCGGGAEAEGEAEADPPTLRVYELKRDAARYLGSTVELEGLVGEVVRPGFIDVGAGAQDVIAITAGTGAEIEGGPVREGDPVRVTGRVERSRDRLLGLSPFTFRADGLDRLRSDYSGEPVLIAERVRVLDLDPADFPKEVGEEPQ